MKKNDLRLFLIFGVLILLFALAGCTPAEQGTGETTGQMTQDSTEQTTESETTTEETTESEEPSETETEKIIEKNYGLANDLILKMIECMRLYGGEYDMHTLSFEDKIDEIKEGKRPILLSFDPTEHYFAGVYYNTSDGHNCYSNSFLCHAECVKEYNWVRFESEKEITEYYNGEKLVVAFQINKSLFAQSILPNDKPDPTAEYFQVFPTAFENGTNTTSPLRSDEAYVYDEAFIYLSPSLDDEVYYYYNPYFHENRTMSVVLLEDQHYIGVLGYDQNSQKIPAQFGKYYDDLIKVMLVGKYSESVDNGTSQYNRPYILFEIEDIVEIILE